MLAVPRASDYLRRFHYDLAMHDPKLTRMLIDLVGADRVVCGADFPQGMAIKKPVEYVESKLTVLVIVATVGPRFWEGDTVGLVREKARSHRAKSRERGHSEGAVTIETAHRQDALNVPDKIPAANDLSSFVRFCNSCSRRRINSVHRAHSIVSSVVPRTNPVDSTGLADDFRIPFEQALTEDRRQVLVENAKITELETGRYPVR